jgi:hypothetical protein
MNSKSLFKIQSLVAILLFSLVAGAAATPGQDDESEKKPASTTPAYTTTSPLEQKLADCLADHDIGECSKYQDAINSTNGTTPINKCEQAQDRANTLQDNANNSMKAMFEAEKSAVDAQNNARKATEAAGLAHRDADRKYAATVQTIQDNLPIQLANQNDAAAKALAKIREQIAKLTTDVIKANASLRQAESAIQKARNQQESTCRAAADAAGKAKKKEIDDYYKALKTAKVNYSASSLAGVKNRRDKRRLADIQAEYMTEYSNCMNGSNAAGADAKNRIEDATSDFTDAKALYAETIAAIQEQKSLLSQQMLDATKANQTQIAAIQQKAKDMMTAALAEYQSAVDKADTAASSAAADLASYSPLYQKQFALAQQTSTTQSQQAAQAMFNLQTCGRDPNVNPLSKYGDDDEDLATPSSNGSASKNAEGS